MPPRRTKETLSVSHFWGRVQAVFAKMRKFLKLLKPPDGRGGEGREKI
jgi:hypothetical protein